MECLVAIRLLDAYTDALRAFHKVQERLLDEAQPGEPDYNRARIDREEAYVGLARARGQYWKHVQMHACRSALSPRSRQKEVYARLQTDLLEARRRFDGALGEYDRLSRIAQDAAGTTDGSLAREQARRVQVTAHQGYMSALQRLTDFVTDGVTPEDVPS
jgi:2-hydroxychromene-2-carboxylate isomerase